MQDQVNATRAPLKRVPWNKGKVTGAKPPLRPKHVWSIRTKFQIEGRSRDLAMFNLAIDSKLRGCDVVAIRSRMSLPASLSISFSLNELSYCPRPRLRSQVPTSMPAS
jgi:hypothetical protein